MVDALAICSSFSPSIALASKFHLFPVSLSTNKLLKFSYEYSFYSSLPSKLQNEFNKKRKSEECFIATAAMGSHLHPYVQSLRNFRDNMLLQSRHKTSFENLLSVYYRLSPPVARSMNRYLILKIFLRYVLVYPIVFGIKGILPVFDVVLGI